GTQRCGTGDVFSAIIAAEAVNGVDFQESVRKASHFVKLCIQKSIEFDLALTDGVCFEELLGMLCRNS
ncbi:MAG: bifunctional hydroxymethylpyrimidine kinase/phosphomethylpyrimidine kinase, partial [Lachnospiraceae bacterium]|nr:bifunctional hydroxymethylpyrimidine kinase/phosphomethylpyrimidine kinase [Lachnospiraceae bacterium]